MSNDSAKMFCFRRCQLGERPATIGAELTEKRPQGAVPLEESAVIIELKCENRELKRQLELARNEMLQVRQSLKRLETEIKVLRGTSYDGTIIWRIHPISLLFLEDEAKKDLPDTHYSGKEIYSLPFYSGK